MLGFNIDCGFLEAELRGMKGYMLSAADYANLCQCENLDDLKAFMLSGEYGPYFADEPSPLTPAAVVRLATQLMVDQWNSMRTKATGKLATFMDMCTHVSESRPRASEKPPPFPPEHTPRRTSGPASDALALRRPPPRPT